MSDKPNPYAEGMAAFEAGTLERHNPHRRHSTNWTRWRGGWKYAEQQKEAKRRLEAATNARAWAQ